MSAVSFPGATNPEMSSRRRRVSAFLEANVVLKVSPCEYVRHHGHRYRIAAVGAQFFFRTARVDIAFFLISYTAFFLSFNYSRSMRAALEERDALLTRYACVILSENEKAGW